jgi:hypothetical protein
MFFLLGSPADKLSWLPNGPQISPEASGNEESMESRVAVPLLLIGPALTRPSTGCRAAHETGLKGLRTLGFDEEVIDQKPQTRCIV